MSSTVQYPSEPNVGIEGEYAVMIYMHWVCTRTFNSNLKGGLFHYHASASDALSQRTNLCFVGKHVQHVGQRKGCLGRIHTSRQRCMGL